MQGGVDQVRETGVGIDAVDTKRGRPRSCMTVLATPTWEDQRLSIPGRTDPPNMMRGTLGP